MSQHTKEPWAAKDFLVIATSFGGMYGGKEVCHTGMGFNTNDVAVANADHIVACVNACEGINPAAVKMMMGVLLKTIEYLNLRADKESSDLWAEVAGVVADAKEGIEE